MARKTISAEVNYFTGAAWPTTTMTTFKHTDAALAFIRTADSRETSPRIMEAICAFAHDTATAVVIWEEGLTNWDETSRHAFIDMVTRDGADSPTDFCWGAAGVQWATDADAARAKLERHPGFVRWLEA